MDKAPPPMNTLYQGDGGNREDDLVRAHMPHDDLPHPLDDGAPPVAVKPTIIGPATRAREVATGDPLPNAAHGALTDALLGKRTINVDTTDDEANAIEQIIALTCDPNMTEDEKTAYLNKIDPKRKLTNLAIDSIEREITGKVGDRDRTERLIRSLHVFRHWEYEETTKYLLQRNDCSRYHKLVEAVETGHFYDGDLGKYVPGGQSGNLRDAKVFVVRHDWAAAFGEDSELFDPIHPFRLPYPHCAFEFRITGHTVIMHLDEGNPEMTSTGRLASSVTLEGVDGVWLSLPSPALDDLMQFCERQVRAISIALEAKVAEHEVMRAPAKLNAKREKQGKPPLVDFHVVDLARRIRERTRAERRPDAQPTGRHVRMHWRRGHWRHYETHTTWIEWMLVGDPDLGFIDKHYRI